MFSLNQIGDRVFENDGSITKLSNCGSGQVPFALGEEASSREEQAGRRKTLLEANSLRFHKFIFPRV